jgi:hypothetical protein
LPCLVGCVVVSVTRGRTRWRVSGTRYKAGESRRLPREVYERELFRLQAKLVTLQEYPGKVDRVPVLVITVPPLVICVR